ncbi:MAG: HlyD family efflux transporter periplasmic adaptor subunit, partial [Lachnospiraceae bacterium]|nr:HlyD family efflux transporter periplasmic adaptor subunit [Lachnospiraceae bacterium]
VSVGQELYTIESTEDMVVYFKVNKYDIGELAVGQSARIKVNNKEYTGKVTKIEQAVTEDAKGVPGVGVEITPDDPDEGFIIGLDAKAYVLTMSEESVMQIPSMAVNSDADGEFVYVYKDGKAVKTAVSVGISNGEKIQILEGLKVGDEVILSEDGSLEITDGMEVKANKGQDE